MSTFELAPAAVARVASLPYPVLGELADASLAEQAEAACRGRSSWPAYVAAYEAAVAARRERLWHLTAGDRRFMLALTFANPTVAARVARLDARGPWNKNRRHFETTLYRYLARAAGRPDPFGLWAGVSLVRFGEETRTSAAPAALKVEPELSPLFALVYALARSSPYRSRGPWKLNPSLHQDPDGSWSFHAPVPGGAVFRRVDPNAGIAELARRLGTRASDLETLADAVAAGDGNRRTMAAAILEACVDGGLLAGGLQPPWRFSTAWEALERIEEDLLQRHGQPWRAARLALRGTCARLQDLGEDLTATETEAGLREAWSVIARLAQALDLAIPNAPVSALRCDMRAGIEIQLGTDVRAGIADTLEAYLRFQGEYGFGAAIRRAMLSRSLPPGAPAQPIGATPSRGAGELPRTWQGVCAALGGDREFAQRIARWEALLGSPADRVDVTGHGHLAAPPFGWLQMAFTTAPGCGGGEMTVHGVFDDLWGPYARHASFWSGTPAREVFEGWIRGHLVEIARAAGIEAAELVVPCLGRPNTLARPHLGLAPVSPWSCLPGEVNLLGASLLLETGSPAPVLVVPGRERPVVVLNASSTDVQSTDAVVQQLLTTSLAAVPTGIARAANVLFTSELGAERPSPAVTVGGHALVRPRRTVLPADVVGDLLRGDVVRRFASWSHLARQHGWPERLIVHRGDGTGLAVPRDSPLAVTALLQGAGASLLVVEEAPDEAWLDCGGQRHVAELSIPFLRHNHLWADRRGDVVASATATR